MYRGESRKSGNDRDQAGKPTPGARGCGGKESDIIPKHQGQEEGRARLSHSALGSPSVMSSDRSECRAWALVAALRCHYR